MISFDELLLSSSGLHLSSVAKATDAKATDDKCKPLDDSESSRDVRQVRVFSFKKKEHLLKKLDFDHVFLLPKKNYAPGFTLLFKKNDLQFSRIGLIVAKRNVSKANKRNTIKRIIRESFRINQVNRFYLDMIVICNKQVTMMDKKTIRAHLDSLWVKIHK